MVEECYSCVKGWDAERALEWLSNVDQCRSSVKKEKEHKPATETPVSDGVPVVAEEMVMPSTKPIAKAEAEKNDGSVVEVGVLFTGFVGVFDALLLVM